MPKVLVVSPPFLKDFARNVRWPTVTKARIQRPPDWLAYTTAVLEEAKCSVKLFDMSADNQSKADFAMCIMDEQPDFVVLDTTTPSIYSDIKCASIVKAVSGAKVIMVGTHVSALPQETLDLSEGAVDYVCVGEYDYTVRDIVLGRITDRIAKSSLIENLDALPFPAWHHLDIMKYFDGGRMYPYIDVVTGRGCPSQCSFCLWPNTMFGHKYRTRSIERVVDEIESDLELFPKLQHGEFFIEDDTFTLDKNRVYAFIDELRRWKLNINWSANARADLCDFKLLQRMKQSGCRSLSVGFESGNQEILDIIHKHLTLEQSMEFADLARLAGIWVHACFVLGLPGETEETIHNTLNFAFALNPATVQFAIAMPFPGTEFFRWCKIMGYLKSEKWSDWAGENHSVFEYPHLSAKTMAYYADKGMKDFYFRPKYVWNYLIDSKSPSDLRRKLKGAFSFLGYLWKK